MNDIIEQFGNVLNDCTISYRYEMTAKKGKHKKNKNAPGIVLSWVVHEANSEQLT